MVELVSELIKMVGRIFIRRPAVLSEKMRNQEANSIAQLNSQLTSLLSFLVFKSEFFSTVNLNREVN